MIHIFFCKGEKSCFWILKYGKKLIAHIYNFEMHDELTNTIDSQINIYNVRKGKIIKITFFHLFWLF